MVVAEMLVSGVGCTQSNCARRLAILPPAMDDHVRPVTVRNRKPGRSQTPKMLWMLRVFLRLACAVEPFREPVAEPLPTRQRTHHTHAPASARIPSQEAAISE